VQRLQQCSINPVGFSQAVSVSFELVVNYYRCYLEVPFSKLLVLSFRSGCQTDTSATLANVICSPRRPAPSRAIRGVLGKFADLPQEAEEEIRGFDDARRRIVQLEGKSNA